MTRGTKTSLLSRVRLGERSARAIYQLAGIAPAWWVGIIGALAIGSYYGSQVQPLEKSSRQLERDAAALGAVQLYVANESADPTAQLAAFYAGFPTVADLPDRVQVIYEALQAQGLVLEQANYKLVREEGDRIVRYEIVLPVKGNYLQIRRFLNRITEALPSLAVGQMQFARAQAADAVIDCRLVMTLYLVDGYPAQ